MGHPLRGTEPVCGRDLLDDRGDRVVGNTDHHQFSGARRIRGIQERDVGQEPRRAIAGGTAARHGDDPVPGTTQQHRHRGPNAPRADDRDVHRSEYPN